jgi:hypothetical protein
VSRVLDCTIDLNAGCMYLLAGGCAVAPPDGSAIIRTPEAPAISRRYSLRSVLGDAALPAYLTDLIYCGLGVGVPGFLLCFIVVHSLTWNTWQNGVLVSISPTFRDQVCLFDQHPAAG